MIRRFFADVTGSDFGVPNTDFSQDSVGTIFNIIFAIAGSIAMIILLLASLKYITSRGDPQAVAKAKNTILYAVIGLVVVASAFTIVGFVVNRV